MSDNKIRFALKSDELNLTKYGGKNVKITGTVIHEGVDTSPAFLEVTEVELLTTSPQEPDREPSSFKETIWEKYLSNLNSPAGVHVVLNKPEVGSHLENIPIKKLEEMENRGEVKFKELVSKGGPNLVEENETEISHLVYRSHYDNRSGVVLFEEPSGTSVSQYPEKLNIIVELPHHVEEVKEKYFEVEMDLPSLDLKKGRDYMKSLGYEVTGTGSADGELKLITMRKENITVRLASEGPKSNQLPDFRAEITDFKPMMTPDLSSTTLTPKHRNRLKDIIYHSGCPEGTDIDWANATSGRTKTVRKVVSSTSINIDRFDFREALETELGWLKKKNLVTGLTREDIRDIASAVKVGATGYNVRTQYRDGEWVVGPETRIKLRDSPGSYIADLPSSGFSMEELPGGRGGGEGGQKLETGRMLVGTIIAGIALFTEAFLLTRKASGEWDAIKED